MNRADLFYPETRFGGFTDIDGTVAFYNRVNALLDSSFTVLDIGCGTGSFEDDSVRLRKCLRILKGKVAKVIGIDVDQRAKENPYLDEFALIQSDTWPINDNSVDLIVCDNVLEHIQYPIIFFTEIVRVLKDGGYICLRTPNRWNYIALAALLLPNKYHSRVNSFVQNGRKEEDVFPTVYKCNTIRKLKRILNNSGFYCVVYGYEAEPSYLSFSTIAYFIGVLHQRLAPRFIKPSIFAFGRINKAPK